ncbi:2317_t:CDS:2, partial [Funneliformis geosporum]
QAEKPNMALNLNDYDPNKGEIHSVLPAYNNPNGPITYKYEPRSCTPLSSNDKNNSYLILSATYAFIEKAIMDEEFI